ncbi:MAG TPA: VCBS repeat-containing protein, partial [Acidobacteriota bacterium]|nr:VCBS repeat-containing protein [Acidobacteriota bacterium]
MSSNGKKENILTSWKEIAAYLDRDVRTCVRWEQRYGLPVHRLERDSKAKVFAYKDQIDEWLAKRSAVEPARTERKGILRFLLRPVPLVFALVVIAAAAYFLFFRPTGPADFHIRGSELIVVDGHGRELWPFDTKLAELETEKTYRGHFQEKIIGADYVPIWPHIIIRDIDGDSRAEVLYSIQTKNENGEGTLICFDHQGHEKWRFDAGAKLAFGSREIRQSFRIFGFNVDDYDGDGTPEVLVLSFHQLDWPCQAVLLDPSG